MTPEEALAMVKGQEKVELAARMRAQGIEVSDAYLPADPAKVERLLNRDEKRLLADVCAVLEHRGYRARTEHNICCRQPPQAGYYTHLHACRRNPIMLDLDIHSKAGRCLEVELKVRPAWRPGQRELIAQGYGIVVHSLTEFIDALNMWESEEL